MTRRARAVALTLVVAVCLATVACGDRGDGGDVLRIGMLRVVVDEDHGAFVDELRNQGWRLGADIEILPPDPETTYDLESARREVRSWTAAGIDLIVAFSTPFATMVAEEAPDVPALFLLNDPVSAGLVSDPLQPDGQMTGVTFRTPTDRTLDLAQRVLGELDTLGYLAPADDTAVPGHLARVITAADRAGVRVVESTYRDATGVAAAVDELTARGVDAVMLANSSGTVRALDELTAALEAARLPTIANTDFVTFALLIVTPDEAEVRRQLARQASRLLSGAAVAAVPVEDPRKFVVLIDQGQARRLGLPPIDAEVLRLADVVR